MKQHGGAALVQDPNDALFDGMPASAIENVAVDFIGDVPSLTQQLVRRTRLLAAGPAVERDVTDESDDLDAVEMDSGTPDPDAWSVAPSQFTCPECHGSLFERQDGTIVRYRCRIGHAFSPDTLAAAQSKGVEDALWIALRALEENAALLRRLSDRSRERGQGMLFASAAHAFGERTLAVILSGNGFDGAGGAAEVHLLGGVVIAQDEASSEFFSMPREGIQSGGVTYVLPLDSIAPAVARLVALGADRGVSVGRKEGDGRRETGDA